MPSLKQDIAFATNLLASDKALSNLMDYQDRADKTKRLVPMRQQPNEAFSKPLISLWIRPSGNLGGQTTSNVLNVDIYTPLTTQRASGIGLDIARRIKEVLDRKPVGRGLRWSNTDPDVRSVNGWHKATVRFDFRSTQF